MKGTRLYLYAPRTSVNDLVDFGFCVYRNLSKWYDEDISKAWFDTDEAERLLQTKDNSSTPDTQTETVEASGTASKETPPQDLQPPTTSNANTGHTDTSMVPLDE